METGLNRGIHAADCDVAIYSKKNAEAIQEGLSNVGAWCRRVI